MEFRDPPRPMLSGLVVFERWINAALPFSRHLPQSDRMALSRFVSINASMIRARTGSTPTHDDGYLARAANAMSNVLQDGLVHWKNLATELRDCAEYLCGMGSEWWGDAFCNHSIVGGLLIAAQLLTARDDWAPRGGFQPLYFIQKRQWDLDSGAERLSAAQTSIRFAIYSYIASRLLEPLAQPEVVLFSEALPATEEELDDYMRKMVGKDWLNDASRFLTLIDGEAPHST